MLQLFASYLHHKYKGTYFNEFFLMRPVKHITFFFLISFLFVFCQQEKEEVFVPQPHSINSAEKVLLDVSNQLGYKCFNMLSQKHSADQNLVVSPVNATLAFNLLLNASDGGTATHIKQYLQVNHMNDTDIVSGFDKLNKLFSEIDVNTKVLSSNIVAADPDASIKPSFGDFVKKRAYTNITQVENSGFIEDIDRGNRVGDKAGFQMINSIDFTASLKYQTGARELPFYPNPDESYFIKMLVAESSFNYYSDVAIQAVELPLGRGNYNMLVVVPQGSQTLNELAKKMDGRLLNRIKNKFKMQAMEVYLPEIDLSGVETFKSVLSRNRLGNCFNKRKANFSKLSNDGPVYLSDFEQLVKFSVEQSPVMNGADLSETKEKGSLLIDHPFLFVVYEKYSEAVLLIGKINNL